MSVLAVVEQALAQGRPALDEAEGKALLAAFGIPTPAGVVVADDAALAGSAAALKPPLVLKVLSREAIHKSDVGGVALKLAGGEAVAAAATAMRAGLAAHAVTPAGWLVEEMAPGGVEMVVGGKLDPLFGPLVMVGLGGVFIEIMADVAIRICPIERQDAVDMIDGLRGAALLRGARGSPPVDEAAVVDVLMRVGGPDGLLMRGADSIAEIDINPLIAGPAGAVAVDARVILRQPASGADQ